MLDCGDLLLARPSRFQVHVLHGYFAFLGDFDGCLPEMRRDDEAGHDGLFGRERCVGVGCEVLRAWRDAFGQELTVLAYLQRSVDRGRRVVGGDDDVGARQLCLLRPGNAAADTCALGGGRS